jgi:transcriptional regulator with XRE-family HTH domain
MPHIEHVGMTLKRYRLSKLWTMRQMSAVTGIGLRTIWMIEHGKSVPHDLTIAKLKKALPDLDINEPITV